MTESPKLSLFKAALALKNQDRPPIWLMRQAGRYHHHYQALRKQHSFMDLCKNPDLACETAMGPMRDFGFDAAILFSDLLFPLEVMGMGLSYDPSPKLDWHLKSPSQADQLISHPDGISQLLFQAEALKKLRNHLSADKGLIGFVGGPLTLYCYAVAGSHKGDLSDAVAGFEDGRFSRFIEKLLPLLVKNMEIQAISGLDTIAMLDTCAGDVPLEDFRDRVIPVIAKVLKEFHQRCPQIPVTYYSKGTSFQHWDLLKGLPIAALGVDWKTPLHEVLKRYGDRYAIQGNIDPSWMLLPKEKLATHLKEVWSKVALLPQEYRRGWICGLGHGVLPTTPEENVRLFVKLSHEVFGKK